MDIGGRIPPLLGALRFFHSRRPDLLVADDGEHAVATFIAEVGPANVLLVCREETLEV
jgi:hypothetical protein